MRKPGFDLPKCSNLEDDYEELKTPLKRTEQEEKEINDTNKSMHDKSRDHSDKQYNKAREQLDPENGASKQAQNMTSERMALKGDLSTLTR